MKKIITILFLMIYSSTAFAVTLDIHFCAGKFSEIILLNLGDKPQCGCDHSNPTHTDCCSDKIVLSKTDIHKTVQPYLIPEIFSSIVLSDYTDPISNNYTLPVAITNYNSSSGFIRCQFPSFLIFICTFRI